MTEEAIESLRQAVSLADRLIELADTGCDGCPDNGCLVVFGIMRDCGYKIRASAEVEMKEHLARDRGAAQASVMHSGGGRRP